MPAARITSTGRVSWFLVAGPAARAAPPDGEIDVDAFLSHRISLDEVNHGFDLMQRHHGIRTVIELA